MEDFTGVSYLGNRECIEFLEQTLERVRASPKTCFVAAITAEGPCEAFHSYVGAYECIFAGITSAGLLRRDMEDALVNRQLPPVDETIPANMVCYDLAVEPCNYDFPCWLAYAEMQRIREGAEGPLRVAFQRPRDNEDTPEINAKKLQMHRDVLVPLVELFGAVWDDNAVYGRRYNTYAMRPIVEAYLKGEALPRLKSKYGASSIDGAPYITITLRECPPDHWKHRNSNVEAWTKFARYLEAKGERVIFVRDTAKAEEPLEGFKTYPPASIDLHARVALYHGAKANLFVSNGPWMMGCFSEQPLLMFVEISLAEPFHAGRPTWWRTNHGIGEGQQFPWFTEHQRIIWKRDTYENLVEAWEKHGPR